MPGTRPIPDRAAPSPYFDRSGYDSSSQKSADVLAKRIDELEKKLDQLIATAGKNRPKPGPAPEDRIAALEGKLNALTAMVRQSLAKPSGEPRPTPPSPRLEPRGGRAPLPIPPDDDPFEVPDVSSPRPSDGGA